MPASGPGKADGRVGASVDREHSRKSLRDRLAGLSPDALVALVLLVAGTWLRWKNIVGKAIFTDNVDPFLRAYAWLADWGQAFSGHSSQTWYELLWPASVPWLPQFGPGLVWSHVPFVVAASDLQAALERRLLLQALVVPLLYIALRLVLGRRITGKGRLAAEWPSVLAGLTAALVAGFTYQPFGLLLEEDQTYLAPELSIVITVAVAAVLLSGRSRYLCLGLALLPWAVMIHPLAVCLAPGLLLVTYRVWKTGGRRIVLVSLAVAALCSIPEAVHLGAILGAGSDPTWIGETVSRSSMHFESLLDPLWLTLTSFIELEPFPAGLLLLLAPLVVLHWRRGSAWWRPGGSEPAIRLADRDSRTGAAWLVAFFLLSMLTLLCLGIGLGQLQPYHWRIVLPAMSLQLGLAIYLIACRVQAAAGGDHRKIRRRTRLLLAAPAVLLLLGPACETLDLWRNPDWGDVVMHRWMAEAVQDDAGKRRRWFEAVVLGRTEPRWTWASPSALYLQQRMKGLPRSRFRLDGLVYLAVNGPAGYTSIVRQRMGWDDLEPEGWNSVGRTGARHGSPLPAKGMGGVHLIGRYPVGRDLVILLIRLDDWRASQKWSGWLVQQFPPGEVRLIMETNQYMPLCMPGYQTEYALRYFDRALHEP